jgi:uncharacterized protein YyaL (SSP411 family)
MARGGGVPNRLARESSPYLLLHAENPVDWYPWGEEAFDRARREDKPIFLSVGYSTCYWCHVMERESFSSPAVAREMNEGFVCIKVDREERPDVDEVYMAATQLMTRSGGWPNSVFLTPDLKPFFAGTYFPPHDSVGRPGFSRVLQSLREAWLFRRPEVLLQAETVARSMEVHLAGVRGAASAPPDAAIADELQAALAARFDPEMGGFGAAPKFPSPANLFFLLERAEDEEARSMLVVTLDAMARGGIMDHLAGGFHRYSTDDAWLVPHFEKMLYDNAALGRLYAEAVPLAPGEGFDRVARRTLDFVLSEMASAEGGFLSAIDAETDGHEGTYYTWTGEELEAALPAPEGELFRRAYGLVGSPPFEGTRYVLHLPQPLADTASAAGLSEEELRRRLEPARLALLAARQRRKHPLVDDKVLTDWNGLVIGALARSGRLLHEPRYVDAARRAAGFVRERLRDGGSGILLHAWRAGRAHVPAFLDDYVFLVEGLLRLHEATGEERWVEDATRLAREQEDRLGDAEGGGYYGAGADGEVPFRSRPVFDGAVASGNGTAVLNLIDLHALTGDAVFAGRAEAALRAFGDDVVRAPLAHVTLVRARVRLGGLAAGSRGEARDERRPRVSASEALEEEARAAVELTGELGRAEDDVWKPFTLDLEIHRGFHVNPHPVHDPDLVATSVTGVLGRLRNVRYPSPEDGGEGLPVWRGRVRIEGEIEHRGGGAAAVEVVYQACDERRCLPPVSRLVRLG